LVVTPTGAELSGYAQFCTGLVDAGPP
jgi:hypothetical protein